MMLASVRPIWLGDTVDSVCSVMELYWDVNIEGANCTANKQHPNATARTQTISRLMVF